MKITRYDFEKLNDNEKQKYIGQEVWIYRLETSTKYNVIRHQEPMKVKFVKKSHTPLFSTGCDFQVINKKGVITKDFRFSNRHGVSKFYTNQSECEQDYADDIHELITESKEYINKQIEKFKKRDERYLKLFKKYDMQSRMIEEWKKIQ